MKFVHLFLLVLLPAATALATPPGGEASAPAAKGASSHVMLDASKIAWGDVPPFLPPGAQFKAISGDPSKPGGMFVVRLKVPAGYRVPRHWHPNDEHVTIIEGTVKLDMGSGSDTHASQLEAGDYVLLPAHMQHEATAQTAAVVQIHGASPFEINYVDPKDDPRNGTPGDSD